MARLPPLSSMETFLEVARHGTVKAAASELGLSMPALSRRIQTLEHAVWRPLFNRHHHGLRLTEAGRALQDQLAPNRSEEHTSELQSLMRISYAVFCLKKKNIQHLTISTTNTAERQSLILNTHIVRTMKIKRHSQ